MIRHIVLLHLQDTATHADRAAITEALATLPDHIPVVRSYVVGTNAGRADGNADIVVVAGFDDLDGYETYRDHPAHQKVIVDCIRPVLARRSAIQFEI